MKQKIIENESAAEVVDVAYHIHTELGSGLLESAYEAIMMNELKKRGLKVENQVPIPITFNGTEVEVGFRADLIVNDKLLIELKSVEASHPSHKKQLTTYLRLTGYRLGLLINFGSDLIKKGITRIANGLPDS